MKICPVCQLQARLDAVQCVQCGHLYSTKFTSSQVTTPAPPFTGQTPAPPPPAAQQGIPPIQGNPTQFGTQIPSGGAGYIQFAPGAHSVIAASFLAIFLPPLAMFYNRQWFKGLAILFLFGAYATGIMLTTGVVAVAAQSAAITVACWATLVAGSIILFFYDSALNAAALELGYPITDFEFFGQPWSRLGYLRPILAQKGWLLSLGVGGVTIIWAAWMFFGTAAYFEEQRAIGDIRREVDRTQRNRELREMGYQVQD